MTRLNPRLQRSALAFLALSFFLLADAHAQKRQAVVIMRSNGSAQVAQCDGTMELNYQIVSDPKLNSKEEVRMAAGLGASGDSASVSREAYEKSQKAKLRDLFAVKWGADGVLYAVPGEGQTPVPLLPDDAKPQKRSSQPLSSFYSVMLTGEAREGKSKRQVSVALRDIQKVYFVPEGAAINDTLFKHAAEEHSVVLWEAYLSKTNNYRQADANGLMREALMACARTDLDTFARGDYGALDKARKRAERAQSVSSDAASRQLVADITGAQQKVDAARAQSEELMRAGKYDAAIDAAEPIKIYLPTWPALNDMYGDALKKSHNQHLTAGQNALDAGRLDEALKECTLAWGRLRDSVPAHDCTCRSRDRVALRDSKNFRLQRRPKDAKELLDQKLADADCPQGEEVVKELGVAKCEYAQQLLAESRRLVGTGGAVASGPGGAEFVLASAPARQRRTGRGAGPPRTAPAPRPSFAGVKAINAQNKKDFRDAREKLVLAAELCPDEAARTLLAAVNRSLSGYCLGEAQKAAQRGDWGTAYVYLESARGYTPDDQNVLGMLSQAKGEFEERTRVQIGVVFDDRSGSNYGNYVLNDVASAVESATTRAGLAQPVVLQREQAAAALRAITSGRQLNSPTVVFYGDLISAGVRREAESRRVPSVYYVPNEERRQWDRAIDEKKKEYENCKKQYGPAQCNGIQQEIERMRAHRDPMPRQLEQPYSYLATTFNVAGVVKLSFRSVDSVSRSQQAADTLGADVSVHCEQREEVNQTDKYTGNSPCSVASEEEYIGQMAGRVQSDASSRALAQLSGLPSSYYRRARSSANRQQSVEDYLRFLFLTGDKGGGEAQDALRALVAYDPELKTDGVLR
jgi:tetratricopeptide (TPR) repeat protein